MRIADVSRAARADTHADTHVDRRPAPRIASPSRSRNMRRAGAFDIDERPNAVTNDASMHGAIAFARHPIRMRCAQSRMACGERSQTARRIRPKTIFNRTAAHALLGSRHDLIFSQSFRRAAVLATSRIEPTRNA
ncbi:hypothetical protein [Burkholderia thailandensis]|uniref:hypothetical protein n=1 Tax=Burkholderia thailandensis TaxID=57975 RepID=UPI00016A316A|nr:hypothetical protein [Burkholderia thailandensis]AJT48653.1 hypothetical protein DR62_06025 [Burkholderia thailandensis]AOI50553.1 hypothetical protein WI24_01215 [Burkholderia thailandensis]AOJ55311.1 hypothetical protein AQ477_01435 [Burkholderia thailandensis]KXF60687.1 hypothetical protein AQ476_04895 [Burkholderia thailandensis]MCS3395433.1 hypothetical protein [Burkholderia thailandensis]